MPLSLLAASCPNDGLFLCSFSHVCQRRCFHNSHRFPVLPAGHRGGRRKALFFLSVLTEAGTLFPGSHPCQIACVAVGWLLASLCFTPGPLYTHMKSTMATSQPAEPLTRGLWLQHGPWGPGSNLAPMLGCQELMWVHGTELVGCWAVAGGVVQHVGVWQELGFQGGVLHPVWSMRASSTPSCLKLSDGPLLLT